MLARVTMHFYLGGIRIGRMLEVNMVDFHVMNVVKGHKYSIEIASKTLGDAGELLSSELKEQKLINRVYLKKVVENVIFLARQGLAFRGVWVSSESEAEGAGTEMNSNFHQLRSKP